MATEDELALVRAAQNALQEFNSCLLALARHGIRIEVTLIGDRQYTAEFSRTERFRS